MPSPLTAVLGQNLALLAAGFLLVSGAAALADDKSSASAIPESQPPAAAPAPNPARARMQRVLAAVAEKDLEVNEMAPLLMQNMPQIRGLVPPGILYLYTEGLFGWQTMTPEMQEEYKRFLTRAPYLQEDEATELRRAAVAFLREHGVSLAGGNGASGKGRKRAQGAKAAKGEVPATPSRLPKGVKAWGVPGEMPPGADKIDPDALVQTLNNTIDRLLAARPNQGPKQVAVLWGAPEGEVPAVPLPLLDQLTRQGAEVLPLTNDPAQVLAGVLGSGAEPFYRWEVAVDDLPLEGTTEVIATDLWSQVLQMTPEAQQQLLYSIKQDAINETMLNLTPEDYRLPELYPDERATRLVYQMLTKERGVKDLGNNFVQVTALRLMQRVGPTALAVAFDPQAQPEVVRRRTAELQRTVQARQAVEGSTPASQRKARPKGQGKNRLPDAISPDLGDYRLDCSRFTANLFLQFQQNPAYPTGSTFTVVDPAADQVIRFTKR
ncbi:MAG TPA: hypothetical protein VEI97_19400 [bacterium]|nr:hypothetical protein [bacterium]